MEGDVRITSPRLVAGEASPVSIEWPDVGEQRSARAHTLELHVIEQRKQRLKGLDLQKNASRSIATQRTASGERDVFIEVPADAAPAYDGTLLAWRYELRLVDFDENVVTASSVDIEPGHTPPDGRPASSSALGYSNLAADPGVDVKFAVLVGIPMLVLAGATFVFAVVASGPDDRVPLFFFGGFGLVTLALAAFVLSSVFSRGRSLGAVDIDIAETAVRRGDDVVVELTGASLGEVEVGLMAVELVTSVSGGEIQNRTARRHPIHEQFVVYDGAPVRLPVPVDGPIGYAGAGVSLHWIVRVRSTRTNAGAGGRPITVWGGR